MPLKFIGTKNEEKKPVAQVIMGGFRMLGIIGSLQEVMGFLHYIYFLGFRNEAGSSVTPRSDNRCSDARFLGCCVLRGSDNFTVGKDDRKGAWRERTSHGGNELSRQISIKFNSILDYVGGFGFVFDLFPGHLRTMW